MIKVRILHAGRFSDFNVPGRPHKVGAKQRAAGDVVDYPDWYAKSIIASGLAQRLAMLETEPQPAQSIDATKAASKLAGELDVNLLTVAGSGAGGRITAGDVRKAHREVT